MIKKKGDTVYLRADGSDPLAVKSKEVYDLIQGIKTGFEARKKCTAPECTSNYNRGIDESLVKLFDKASEMNSLIGGTTPASAKPEQSKNTYLIIGAIVIVIAILVFIIVKKLKK